MENLTIRKATFEDKENVNQAHVTSIQEVCINDYSQYQVDRWSAVKYSDDIWRNTVENDCCYVVELNNSIEGVCHSRVYEDGTGEIVGLYLTPKVIGKGIGRKIFEKCMDYIKESNSQKVFISGTKTAKGFYETMGFKEIKSEIVNIRGADVETFYMECIL